MPTEKKRVMVTLRDELWVLLEANARRENRSLSNYIETLLWSELQKMEKSAGATAARPTTAPVEAFPSLPTQANIPKRRKKVQYFEVKDYEQLEAEAGKKPDAEPTAPAVPPSATKRSRRKGVA